MTPHVTATDKFNVTGFRMHRRQLDRLWRAAGEELSSRGEQSIYTQRSITRIRASTPSDLESALEDSTEPGDPELLDNMWITARDPQDGSRPARSVTLIVTEANTVECTVTGDPTWVRGRSVALRSLIDEARPFKWRIWYAPPLSYAFAGSAANGLWYIVDAAFVPDGFFSDTWSVAITVTSWLLFFMAGLAVGREMARRSRVEIWLKRQDLPQRRWHITAGEFLMSAVALLAVIVSIVFGVVTHLDANKDEKKPQSASQLLP
ncbi:hypothetical protein AB0M42_00620 [Streptomyces sp. NPDC051784]|uniref:hypothetical protein n=1 Tax=Streptomyces sp. NPDC051784 TaxID=3155805 RepID=UPI00343C89D2